MSLILDALRKLDRQKSLNRKGTVDLAASILSPDASPPRKKWRFYLAAVFLTAVVTASITYLAVVGSGSRGKSPSLPSAKFPPSSEQVSSSTPEPEPYLKISPPAAEKPSLASREVPPAAREPGTKAKSSPPSIGVPRASHPRSEPVSSAALPPQKALTGDSTVSPGSSQRAAISPPRSGSPTESSPAAPEVPIKIIPPSTPAPVPRETVRQVQSGKTEGTPKIETHPETIVSTPSAGEKMPARKAIPEKADRATGIPQKSAETGVSGPPSSLPQLKISGIMWHDEPSKRRAVINGTFTSEGSTIEGVEVVEILPTQVRFVYQGRAFEISIFE
jgi:Type II secretion system protein B